MTEDRAAMNLSTFLKNEKKTTVTVEAGPIVDVEDQSILDISGQSEISEGRWLEARFVPSLDLYRNDQHYTILMDLPGVDPSQVQVSVRDCLLTISGTRDISIPKYRLVRSEIISSDFERVVRLPREANKDEVQASYRHGVLTITVARKEESTSTRLDVQSPDEKPQSTEINPRKVVS